MLRIVFSQGSTVSQVKEQTDSPGVECREPFLKVVCDHFKHIYTLTKEIPHKTWYSSFCVWSCTTGTSGGTRQHENMGFFSFLTAVPLLPYFTTSAGFSLSFCTAFAFTLWANLYLTPVLQSLYSTILWQTIIDLTVMLCALKINDKNPSKTVRLILITFQVRFLSQLSDLSSYFITIHVRHCMLISYGTDLVILKTICKWKRMNIFGRTGKQSCTVYSVVLIHLAGLKNSALLLEKKNYRIFLSAVV